MPDQYIDKHTATIPGPAGDITPKAREALDGTVKARDEVRKYAAGTRALQDQAVAGRVSGEGPQTGAALDDLIGRRRGGPIAMSLIGRKNLRRLPGCEPSTGTRSVQAGVVLPEDNAYVFPVINASDDSADVFKVDLDTGAVLASIKVTGAGHCNGACVKDGNILLLSSFLASGDTSYQVVELDHALTTITRHQITNYPVAGRPQFLVCMEDGTLVTGGAGKNSSLVMVGADWKAGPRIPCRAPAHITADYAAYQGAIRIGDTVGLIMDDPNQIIRYSLDGSYVGTLLIGDEQGGVYYGELENGTQVGSRIYINAGGLYGSETYSCLYAYDVAGLPLTASGGMSVGAHWLKGLCVDSAADDWKGDGTGKRPFDSINLAVYYARRSGADIVAKRNNDTFPECVRFYAARGSLRLKGGTVTGGLVVRDSQLTVFSATLGKGIVSILGTDYAGSLIAVNSLVKMAAVNTAAGGIANDNSLIKQN